MTEKTAVLIGATGLIGSLLLEELVKDSYFDKIRLLVRRPFDYKHPKVEIVLVDFNNRAEYAGMFGIGDSIFSCIGTTNRKVKGNKDEYRKVDFDIPAQAAEYGSKAGFKKFLIVSSVGASSKASNFYLKLKGETEEAVTRFPFESVFIFRPSMLLGNRKESRPLEIIGNPLMRVLSLLFVANLRKYKPIQASQVAHAMLKAAKSNGKGVIVEDYNWMVS